MATCASSWRKQATELGISQRTIFHGARDHEFVEQRMKEAVLFIQHSVTIPGEGVESLGTLDTGSHGQRRSRHRHASWRDR